MIPNKFQITSISFIASRDKKECRNYFIPHSFKQSPFLFFFLQRDLIKKILQHIFRELPR